MQNAPFFPLGYSLWPHWLSVGAQSSLTSLEVYASYYIFPPKSVTSMHCQVCLASLLQDGVHFFFKI